MIAARVAGVVVVAVAVSSCASKPVEPLADGSDASVQAAITGVTTFPTELDPRLWNGTDLKPEIRERTLKVVDRIAETSGIPGLTVDSVELTGSNASYEYDDTSDFGVHVFAHSAALPPKDLNVVLKLLNDEVERRQEGRITFHGVPLEVVFHGERTEGSFPVPGIGKYSVSQGRWIEQPVQQPDRFDRAQMATDMKAFIGKYNALVSDYTRDKTGFACSRFGDLDAEMSKYRNTGFANGSGGRSTQNLAFRALRRINVNIPQAVDDLEDACTFAQDSIG
jgi:hypothetical protein